MYYTPDVTVALKEVWEAGGEVCGELLHPVVKEYVNILKRDKMWKQGDEATGKLLAMSMGTMKNRVGNFLKARGKGHGMSSTRPSQLKHIIPIFHGDWSSKLPGTGQIDTVVHCGHTLVGDLVFTLNYIDVSTLWDITQAQEKLKKEHEKLNPLVMKNEIDRRKKILYDTQRKHGTTEF